MIVGAIIIWILFGIITSMAAEKKGRDGCGGFILGALLGPFGFIIALLLDPIEETSDSQTLKNGDISFSGSGTPEIKLEIDQDFPGKFKDETNVFIVVQDFSHEFIFDWPLIPLKTELESVHDKSFMRLKGVEFRNVQYRIVNYSEWEILCYDILERPIISQYPILLKIEKDIHPGDIQKNIVDIKLPPDTKKIELKLLNVLLEDGQILNFKDAQPQKIKVDLDPITSIFNTDRTFIDYLSNMIDWDGSPEYIYKINSKGIWNCTFCGVLNKSEFDKCQCCGALVNLQEDFSERNLLEVFSKWKSEQLRKKKEMEIEQQRQLEIEKEQREKELEENAALKKERKRRLVIICAVVIFISLVIGVLWFAVLKNIFIYQAANTLAQSGDYFDSSQKFIEIYHYKDSKELAHESYRKYLEDSMNKHIASASLIVSGYDWLHSQGYPKEKIFESVKATEEIMEGEKWEIILNWLDSNNYDEFLPTIKLFSLNEVGQDILVKKIIAPSFSDYINLPSEKSYDSYGAILVGWDLLNNGERKSYKPSTKVRFLEDQNIYARREMIKVGDEGPAGGIVIYDKGDSSNSWRFIEVAPVTTEWANIAWSGFMNKYYGLKASIGAGLINTKTITENITFPLPLRGTQQFAVQLCENLEYNGYDDWILPSKDELNLMYEIHKKDSESFSNTSYWSSTDKDEVSTWVQSFINGSQYGESKYKRASVRAVRYF